MVEFEDLALLDAGDLRAVFSQVEPERLVAALAGAGTGLCRQLLGNLPLSRASQLAQEVNRRQDVPRETALAAQRELVDALCHLARAGIIAFDDPEDMMPDSLVA